MGCNDPIWIDGYPANLEAASLDALEWVKYLRRVGSFIPLRGGETHKRMHEKLDAVIGALRDNLPAGYELTPKMEDPASEGESTQGAEGELAQKAEGGSGETRA